METFSIGSDIPQYDCQRTLHSLNEIRHISVHRIPISVKKLSVLLGTARDAMRIFQPSPDSNAYFHKIVVLHKKAVECSATIADQLPRLASNMRETKERVEKRLAELEKDKAALLLELETAKEAPNNFKMKIMGSLDEVCVWD